MASNLPPVPPVNPSRAKVYSLAIEYVAKLIATIQAIRRIPINKKRGFI
jgi:hypothetical protein